MTISRKICSRLEKSGGWLVFFAAIFYVAVFLALASWKYFNFGYNAMDLAIINQVFYNSSRGNFFASSIHPPSYLGDHFSPILLIFLPFYWFYARPLTLIILQTLVLAACSWPVYLIAKKILDKKIAVLVALAWLLNPFAQNVNLFEFSFLPFAVFFLFWAFYYYNKNKFFVFLFFCFLALLVREDVALIIFAFGLLSAWDRKKLKWIITPLVLSLAYFFFALKITTLFSAVNDYKFLLYYSWLGNSWPEIIKNALFSPWRLLPRLFGPVSLIIAFCLMLPAIFLPLFSPAYLLLSLPIFLQLCLGASGNGLAVILFTQYSCLLLPGIALAAIFGLKKIMARPPNISWLKFLFQEKFLLGTLVIITMVYAMFALGPLGSSAREFARNGLAWPETKNKKELLSLIPAPAAVAASYDLLTPLSSRQNIASLNYVFLHKLQFLKADYALPQNYQYLAVDFSDLISYYLQYGLSDYYQSQYLNARKLWPEVLRPFGLIYIRDSLALFEKNAPDKFELVKILDRLPARQTAEEISLGEGFKFLGYNCRGGAYQLFWQADLPLKLDYFIKLTLLKGKTVIKQKIYPLAYDLLYADTIRGQKNIQTNYWFEFSGGVAAGTYELSLDLIRLEKGSTELNGFLGTKNKVEKEIPAGQTISLGQITL